MLRDTPEESAVVSCDLEPIHIPGSIQPHGVLLVADEVDLSIIAAAGYLSEFLPRCELGQSLAEVLAIDLHSRAAEISTGSITVLGRVDGSNGPLNAVAYRSGAYIVVELDRAEANPIEAVPFLVQLDAASTRFERTTSIAELSQAAADVYREITGYSRVMVYQFVDDDAGVVVGESVAAGSGSFMNHHFPASDIPKQARALYLRNKVRVIPDVDYIPAPITGEPGLRDLDLSDSTIRSVSPVHVQYLKNMGVAASASFSIVKDGFLWGLIACHDHVPRQIPLSARMGCQALANALSRQVGKKEEAALFRERIRLRSQEDTILTLLGGDRSLDEFLRKSGPELARLLSADGFAAVQGRDLFTWGKCPDNIDIRKIAEEVRLPAARQAVVTTSLSARMSEAVAFADRASGLVAVTMSTEIPTILMWFRAEHVEVLKWAGNPHKDMPLTPGATLTPRASFEAWSESVRGRSRKWSHAEVEAAGRVVKQMLEARNNSRMRELNRELTTTLRENESLLTQKDYLLKEVNHRVQNSLTLVSSFLRMQAKASQSDDVKSNLDAAQKRVNAVALVHRRLYQDESVEVIDLSRYVESLLADMLTTMDAGWADKLSLELAPILISNDRAVNVGLILTELVINAQKYAYGGAAGPLAIRLEQHRDRFRLTVADAGRGKHGSPEGSGFGSKMLLAMVDQLQANLDEENNNPGLRVTLTAPIHRGT
jgi:light-regulated signal transduction histidine kinase (bacteriophytochrome)